MAGWEIGFSDLSVGYGENVVLRELCATLPAGKISVVLGGSGCGKSTLLRHIIGLARPMCGKITIAGQDLFAQSAEAFRRLRRQMGVLFQDGALLGAMTLLENVALPLTEHLLLPRKTLYAEALRVLSMVGLSDQANLYPNQLSGGMRKRAGLARAIITNPRILLCDEPTSGLDPITAARMDALLLSLHARFPEMTMVIVSHDLASLLRIAENVLVLKEGRSCFSGSLAELQASEDPYLRRFLAREGGESTACFDKGMQPEVLEALSAWWKR